MSDYVNENNYYKTSDLSLASAICHFGYQIEMVNKDINGDKIIFFFKRDETLDNIIQSFWSHNLQVDPQRYFSCVKELKSRIYNNQ